jgi:hypothetical protein
MSLAAVVIANIRITDAKGSKRTKCCPAPLLRRTLASSWFAVGAPKRLRAP